ncbi:RCC1 domain-containing protein [Euzebya pacifica]|uniref:RCC1 domain-containing protein n=1 Tax=Euzebya pacifica TaxID=1608957 RepID=UPI0013E07784|nr:RCC1 domain-containing protein [Euzebya pacifica]
MGDNTSGQAPHWRPGPYSTITAASNHTCALTTTGRADCWGSNDYGQASDRRGPFSAIDTSQYYTCAVTVAGAAACWGSYGIDDSELDRPGPYTDIAVGSGFACAVDTDDAIDCWTLGSYGRDMTEVDGEGGPYTAVTASENHVCALASDGYADCWGSQSGAGPYLTIDASPSQTCGLIHDGSAVECWPAWESDPTVYTRRDFALPMTVSSWLPTPNADGWHREPVSITYSCSGGVTYFGTTTTCPDRTDVTGDGIHSIAGIAVDDTGELQVTNTVNIDTTAPTVLPLFDSQPTQGGWFNRQVLVTFDCSDATSGVATCSSPVTVDTDGITTVNGTATDMADNATSTPVTVKLDMQAPTSTYAGEGLGLGISITPGSALTGTADDTTSGIGAVTVRLTDADGATTSLDAELDCSTGELMIHRGPSAEDDANAGLGGEGASCTWRVDNAPSGSWTLSTSASDMAGNVEEPVDHGTVIIV